MATEVNKEWLFADHGIIGVGGIVNGVYPTDAPNQVEYLVNDSGTRFYFAEDEEQLDKVLEVREGNLPAQLLYRECGYSLTEIWRSYYGDEDGYRMARKVPTLPELGPGPQSSRPA